MKGVGLLEPTLDALDACGFADAYSHPSAGASLRGRHTGNIPWAAQARCVRRQGARDHDPGGAQSGRLTASIDRARRLQSRFGLRHTQFCSPRTIRSTTSGQPTCYQSGQIYLLPTNRPRLGTGKLPRRLHSVQGVEPPVAQSSGPPHQTGEALSAEFTQLPVTLRWLGAPT